MRVTDAAKVLGVGEQRVRTLIRAGRISASRDERGYYEISPEALEEYSKNPVASLTMSERMERVESLLQELIDREPSNGGAAVGLTGTNLFDEASAESPKLRQPGSASWRLMKRLVKRLNKRAQENVCLRAELQKHLD